MAPMTTPWMGLIFSLTTRSFRGVRISCDWQMGGQGRAGVEAGREASMQGNSAACLAPPACLPQL